MDPPLGAEVVLIVAVAPGRIIGARGQLPWRLPEDLKRFKDTTMGHPMVMGRKTFDSLGKPLPGRAHIVVTRDAAYALPEGVHRALSPAEALRRAAAMDRKVFVIGGGEVFAAALPQATEVLATLVFHPFAGDALFPRLDRAWHVVGREDFTSEASQPAALDYSIARLRRGKDDDCALCRVRAGLPPLAQGTPTRWDAGAARVLADLAGAPPREPQPA